MAYVEAERSAARRDPQLTAGKTKPPIVRNDRRLMCNWNARADQNGMSSSPMEPAEDAAGLPPAGL
jgi:hypothetical protein